MKVVLIGSGNVARAFGPAFRSKGHQVIQVYSRTLKNAQALSKLLKCEAVNRHDKINREADLYFVCLTDEASRRFLKKFYLPDSLVVHSSGSLSIDVIHPKCKKHGVIYPMYSFTKETTADLRAVTFFIEGNNEATRKHLTKLAKSFSPHVYKADSTQRLTIHAAAVFANNFTNHMLVISKEMLDEAKIPFSVFYPMIEKTFSRITQRNPSDLQTGPARRHDKKTLKAHADLLQKKPVAQAIYRLLSRSIESRYPSK